MAVQKPRLVIAALRGGSGKTLISLGLTAAWRLHHGLRVIPFKKGPDYIDAGWLAQAAGCPCYNLDSFLMQPDALLHSFLRRSNGGDLSLIEGNRGLYDGVDAQGSFSTAELAKLLQAPVVLVVDATKMTRTAAALVLGCQQLDPQVSIAGVILNQVAGKRHERVLRSAIERYCKIPVLGVVPKEAHNFFPERHMGLIPPQESAGMRDALQYAAEKMADCVDLQALRQVAQRAAPLGLPFSALQPPVQVAPEKPAKPVVIGVIRDAAFQFYYPENLEALQEKGAVLQEISSFEDRPLPSLDGLYIGGGFPETQVEHLSANGVFRDSVRQAIEAGLPVYAECGGLMFLCREIHYRESAFPMAGVFPFHVELQAKPQGHGYTVLECVTDNPYFAAGTTLRGHEFHYSRLVGHDFTFPFAFRLKKGHGIVAGWDGMCYKRVLAGYSHIHAVGNDSWAEAMVRTARGYRRERSRESMVCQGNPEQNLTRGCGIPNCI